MNPTGHPSLLPSVPSLIEDHPALQVVPYHSPKIKGHLVISERLLYHAKWEGAKDIGSQRTHSVYGRFAGPPGNSNMLVYNFRIFSSLVWWEAWAVASYPTDKNVALSDLAFRCDVA
ncbi:jg26054 [Pararge aegeria aegeria]|uniref:Jg26054 protein n=1 Tax=Pararge aegeria aegeria TaxID=348720 RepID=A0A8S4QPB2_9NEOP|nr:jg26054 [Pararge aegeria aegeria]